MALKCRVLETGTCEITWGYKKGTHNGIDLVGANSTLQWEVAHSDGVVVQVQSDCDYNTYPNGKHIYGNYVKIKHDDGYYTLYAHIKYGTVQVKVGQRVKRGQRLGYMGNTGYSNGGHLHWEVRNTSDVTIDPTPYLNADLPSTPTPTPTYKYKIGDVVDINGVYVSSTSTQKLTPAITRGTITRIVDGTRNPYLLDNGNIGWVNDSCIVSQPEVQYKTVTNCYWLNLRTSPNYGNNVYTAVQAGTKLEYITTIDGWAKVKYKGKVLYCGSQYLK